jgi:hypothetical protein
MSKHNINNYWYFVMVIRVELTDFRYVCCRYCVYLKLLSAFLYITNIRQCKRLIKNVTCDRKKSQGYGVVLLGCVASAQNLPLDITHLYDIYTPFIKLPY